MTNFLTQFIRRRLSPAQSAKDRLKLVLVTDRTSISPEDINKMQREILQVIRKYCQINEEAVELKFEQRARDNYLVADIPIFGSRQDKGLTENLVDVPRPESLPEDEISSLKGLLDEAAEEDEEATQIIRYRKFDDFDF